MQKRVLLGLATALLLFGVGADSGGFFPHTWRWTSLALLCTAGAGLLLRERVALSRRDGLALLALFGTAAWMLASRLWSSVPALALPEAERALVYGAALLALLVLLDGDSAVWALVGLVAAAVVLSAWGIGDYVSSHANGVPLIGPLGYANGAGGLAATALVVTVGLALDTGSRTRMLVALGPLAVLVPTLVLVESAGSWIALAAGLLVLGFAHRRLLGRRVAAAAVGLVAAGVVVWFARGHAIGSLTGNIRWSYWRVALDDYRAHPLLGSGAGSFGRYWSEHKTARAGALDAHSLYVESLAELGLVGIALVVLFVAVVLRAAARRLTGVTAVAGAAFVTYAVHTGVDWDWELPAVTLAGLTLAGVVLVRADGETDAKPLSSPSQLALAAAAVALAVLTFVRLKTAGG